MSEVRVLRQLPYLLRKAADPGTAMRTFTLGLGRAVDALVDDTLAVASSRLLGGVANRTEARRVAALLRLVPWPDEDLRAFRTRIRTMAGIYRRGAADAERLLRLLGLCADAEPELVLRPLSAPKEGLRSDRWTTVARLRCRSTAAPVPADFHALVEDLPVCEERLMVEPAAGAAFAWKADSGVVGTPAMTTSTGETAATGVMPAFTISAGSAPLVGSLLVQRDLRRVVLINRVVPAGGSLTLDLDTMKVAGSNVAALALLDGQAPDLLYGTAGSWAGTDPWDLPAALADSERDRLLRLYLEADLVKVGAAADGLVPGATLSNSLPWPPLVTPGRSRWALLCADHSGTALPWQQLRFIPAAAISGRKVEMKWHGRRPASFTVRFLPARCSADGTADDPVRRAWFDEQVRRLKLAGIRYIRQEDTWEPDAALAAALVPTPSGDVQEQPAQPPAGDTQPQPASPNPSDGQPAGPDVDPGATPGDASDSNDGPPDVDDEASPDSGTTNAGTVPDPTPPIVDETPVPPTVPGGLVHRTVMGACLVQGLEPLAASDHLTWTVRRKGE